MARIFVDSDFGEIRVQPELRFGRWAVITRINSIQQGLAPTCYHRGSHGCRAGVRGLIRVD